MTLQDLADLLHRIDGRGYGDYKRAKGRYRDGDLELVIDHVQGDPFAAPSRLRAILPSGLAALPAWALTSPDRRRAAADFLNRRLVEELHRWSADRGSGRSGEMHVVVPSQAVLARSSVFLQENGAVEARFRAGLPARGRRILGRPAAEMLCRALPAALRNGLTAPALNLDALQRHVETVEDACALRAQLGSRGLVAFVADGSMLPRRSGVDDQPLPSERTTPFRAPDSLRVELAAPNAGPVTGLGLPAGVTLITGGGYHGKSTLLRAIERGVYDHGPGDGREQVVTVPDAVKVRAEDGRSIAGTDISNFVHDLPSGDDASCFHTTNASGSTSQAAAIVEALEAGTSCLLVDEDTSATNFMIRDARMQELIAAEHEPITPFIDWARPLCRDQGVSTIIVVGGSGDYFDVADTVIAMRAYEPHDETTRAREIAARRPTGRKPLSTPWRPIRARIPLPASIDPRRGRKDVNIKTRTENRVEFGSLEIELSAVEQLVEIAQVRAIADAIVWARGRGRIIDGARPLSAVLQAIRQREVAEDFDTVSDIPTGESAAFRVAEFAAFLSRIRSLQIVDC